MRKMEHLESVRLVASGDSERSSYRETLREAILLCMEEYRNIEFTYEGETYSVFVNALLDCSVPNSRDNVDERDIDKVPCVIDASQLQPGDVFTPLSLIPRYRVR